jgi:hypothetical protein
VELQDFALQHLYSQFAYARPEGGVIDKRGSIATAMGELLDLSEVRLDDTAAEVRSSDDRDQYRVGVAQTYASLMRFDDLDDASKLTTRFFETAMELTGTPALGSMNLRSYDIAPVDSFVALRDRLTNRLTALASGLTEAAGMELKDLAWVFEMAGRGSKANIQFGPMESEQLAKMLRDEGGDYPPSVLFLSIDMNFKPGDADKREALTWWAEGVEENRRLAANIGRWLRETIA